MNPPCLPMEMHLLFGKLRSPVGGFGWKSAKISHFSGQNDRVSIPNRGQKGPIEGGGTPPRVPGASRGPIGAKRGQKGPNRAKRGQ